MMKKQDLLYFPFYIIISILVLLIFNIYGLHEYETLKNSLYERPLDICRLITNHTYKDTYYGGLTNYLGKFGMSFLMGIGCFGVSFPATYIADKIFFKRYFFKYLENENNNKDNNKRVLEKAFLFFFIIPIPPLIYDLLPFIFYRHDTYNCLAIIKYVESSW